MQAITLSHLIRHNIDERNREWFASTSVAHTISFPFARYTIGRTALVGAAAWNFLPTPLLAAILGFGVLMAALQAGFARSRMIRQFDGFTRAAGLRTLMLVNSIGWTATIFTCIWLAPPRVDEAFMMIAALVLVIDALALLAFPVLSLGLATVQVIGISGPLLLRGSAEDIVSAAIAPLALVCIHWGVFHLHHQSATRRLQARELKEKNETVQLLLNQYDEEGSDWLFETDHEGNFFAPSGRFCRAAGLPREQLTGLRFSNLMEPGEERNAFRDMVMAGKPVRSHVVPVNIRGKRRWWSISARPFFDNCGKVKSWRGFVADVTSTREAEDRVAYLAHYDSLTGLPNRNLFGATLALALSRREAGRHVGVIQIDLTHFKAVNDMHGHEAGDRVLADIALSIKSCVPNSAMVARLDGDEFAVILEHLHDPNGAMKFAKLIGATLKQPIAIEGQQLQIGFSMGVATSPTDGASGEDIVRSAGLAMLDAKIRGRNFVSIYAPVMQEQIQDRREIEHDLRLALGQGELEVHYQPLVNAQTGRPVGYEALLRWNHSRRGSIGPSTFIPIAEESGLIIPIGNWVLREALEEAATWPHDIFVSVNLSPVQMKDPKLVGNIVMALSASGISPSRVELEITESVLMTDSKDNLALLHKIRDLGVKIALDDFGTGYSSLSYLRSFPFDKIKIDRCFITDLAEKSDSQAIVTAVIKLAEELGMCTLAEGVENIEQLERLRETGCEQVQGFLFSRAKRSCDLEHKQGSLVQEQGPKASIVPFVKGDAARPENEDRGRRAAG
ncbi:MAG TPA: EAL domain-containing protein [Sphingomonadaceae bacterium]|nr:EAL domain-containing protein [Sphingomonadaceae bacterium]